MARLRPTSRPHRPPTSLPRTPPVPSRLWPQRARPWPTASTAPSGQIAIRFLDQSTAIGNIDIYMVPSGTAVTAVSSLQSNVSFGTNTGYLNIPVGTYTLYIVSNGTALTTTTTTLYTGAATAYPQGSARTIVILDRQLVTTPALNVIVANDYDSATATQ
ncbi:MAG: DUF4397 domain-containing protein [Acidobacteria bacterium]|nr:DUF4397 domain-containing protein [Acidobacteriota bacterium]